MADKRTRNKKKITKKVGKGIVYLSVTFNNTVITITDEVGNVLCWSTAGALGFKGSKKSTPYAAQQTMDDVLVKAREYGIKELGVRVQGPGGGRETALKTLGSAEGIKVLWLKDVTPLPHNGCRPPKRRRV